jgi:hypothetical protein
MPNAKWYWHRLRAMGLGELILRFRKKWYNFRDSKCSTWPQVDLAVSTFPKLPDPAGAPDSVLKAVKADAERIAKGQLRFYGHVDVSVDTPPNWQRDYQAGVDVPTCRSAFDLNHRELPSGAAIKSLWEPSRWYGPVRLAQACWLLGNRRSGELALDWLEDWVEKNPPYIGWHWTSALETGMRLVAFTWIDAFLNAFEAEAHGDFVKRLAKLREQVLLPHVWYTWRHRSFGSSANNHLIGEISGLALAVARWPGLAKLGATPLKLSSMLERETLTQFHPDGGNFEQALNYHFYSWEFCWEARQALEAVGGLSAAQRKRIDGRLGQAARYFREVQVPSAPWDYGDSDDAYVCLWFVDEIKAAREWWQWLAGDETESAFYHFIRGKAADALTQPEIKTQQGGWRVFPETGFVVNSLGHWKARVDFSPLGSGSMAAHGHLDAQHLSLWLKGRAMVIDPGTGDYHGNPKLRNWLAGREVHNGPNAESVTLAKREGPFLWGGIHSKPLWSFDGEIFEVELRVGPGALSRTIKPIPGDREAWQVRDSFEETLGQAGPFTVRWQFAPYCQVDRAGDRVFRVSSGSSVMTVELGGGWAGAELCQPDGTETVDNLDGIVSPRFMKTAHAPYLRLTAKPGANTDFTTNFSAE